MVCVPSIFLALSHTKHTLSLLDDLFLLLCISQFLSVYELKVLSPYSRRDLSPNPLPFFSEEASYRAMYQVTVLVVSGWVARHPSSPGPTHRVVSRTDDITAGWWRPVSGNHSERNLPASFLSPAASTLIQIHLKMVFSFSVSKSFLSTLQSSYCRSIKYNMSSLRWCRETRYKVLTHSESLFCV